MEQFPRNRKLLREQVDETMQNECQTAFLKHVGLGIWFSWSVTALLQPEVVLSSFLSIPRAAPVTGGKWGGRIDTGK